MDNFQNYDAASFFSNCREHMASRRHQDCGKLKVILTLHVDGGLLFGTRSDPIYWRGKGLSDAQFDAEGWDDLNNSDS